MFGKRGPYRPRQPVDTGDISATCEFCGVNAPARKDGSGKPMQHYDGRVEKAWESHTYCDGRHH